MSKINQKLVRHLFTYDAETGSFSRRITTGSTSRQGDVIRTTNASGYVVVGIKKQKYYVHRLIWLYVYGVMPVNQIDHINHKQSDNRLCNLRDVTQLENNRNQPKQSRNKSGATGVVWNGLINKWVASIGINGESLHLGVFKKKKKAKKARKKAEKVHNFHKNHGDIL